MYDYIYKSTLEATDFESLKKKLKDLYIDEKKEGKPFITVAAQLALDGQLERVEWLRQLGASVDLIAFAYAQAENHNKVDEYRMTYKANINLIAEGYAIAENHPKVEEYIKIHKSNSSFIARGYALVGNDGKVNWYRMLHQANVNFIVEGYVLAGNHKKVEEYRKKHNADINIIALNYALAGNHEKVEEYRKDHNADINTIAYGYALAGNHKKVEEYYKIHHANLRNIYMGYQAAGNISKLKEYNINTLLESYKTIREKIVDSEGNTKEYLHSSKLAFFQKRFSQKKDAITDLKSALNGDDVDLTIHLSTLRNGKLGQELRKFIKSGKANELVDKKVNTVRDFVKALQNKVNAKQQQNTPV